MTQNLQTFQVFIDKQQVMFQIVILKQMKPDRSKQLILLHLQKHLRIYTMNKKNHYYIFK